MIIQISGFRRKVPSLAMVMQCFITSKSSHQQYIRGLQASQAVSYGVSVIITVQEQVPGRFPGFGWTKEGNQSGDTQNHGEHVRPLFDLV